MGEVTRTVGLTFFKRNLEKVTRSVNESGKELVVMRRNAPWIKVVPLATRDCNEKSTKD